MIEWAFLLKYQTNVPNAGNMTYFLLNVPILPYGFAPNHIDWFLCGVYFDKKVGEGLLLALVLIFDVRLNEKGTLSLFAYSYTSSQFRVFMSLQIVEDFKGLWANSFSALKFMLLIEPDLQLYDLEFLHDIMRKSNQCLFRGISEYSLAQMLFY